ncbi:MAG: DUF4956 domain-containing protein [Clostridium sp.]|uniref:DUF4956 domain-containing protein n=1 Tax=Clostridium sp. TaxID=1506 RepID=UPI002FCAAB71
MTTFMQYLMDNDVVFSAFQIFKAMGVSLIVSLGIFLVYKLTYKGVVYSRNFNISLVMITLITTAVIMVIGSNIALSLGMVGALSIVRFRTAIKDPRDTAFIFWSIGVGLSVGTGSYAIAIIASIFIMIVLFGLSLVIKRENKYLLVIRADRSAEENIMKSIFASVKNYNIRAKNTTEHSIEIVCEIRLGNNEDIILMQGLYSVKGVKTVNIVSQTGEMIG